MSTFVLVVAILGAWEVCGTLFYLAKGAPPERTRTSMAWNAAVWAGFVGWAIYLIGGAQ